MNLLQDVQKYFPIEEFRFSQQNIIENLLSERDVMAIMPTGGGKSLCYQYPALKLDGITIVVSPLISLMKDQCDHLNELGIPAVCLNSELKGKEKTKVMLDILNGQYKLVYLSPERLVFPKFVRFAKKLNISMVVVDEAHCASLWGYDFRPDYLKIPRFFAMTGKRPIIAAFTATATEFVKNDVIRILNMKNPYIPMDGYKRTNLNLSVKQCKGNNDKFKKLYEFLNYRKEKSGIIYCATIESVKDVYEHLSHNGYEAACYYSSMEQDEKERNFDEFVSGKVKIMIATNAFGMGIDKSDIRYVFHFDMSKDIESYYQEIGRAGRDGNPSDCRLLYCKSDEKILISLVKNSDARLDNFNGARDVLLEISNKRLNCMIEFARKGKGKSSDDLLSEIYRYFESNNIKPDSSIDEFQDNFIKNLCKIDCLYTNETKIAKVIRNGQYKCGEINTVKVSGSDHEEKNVDFFLDMELSYFDMMVSDAVYTLYVWGKEKFFVKNILQLLTGDEDVTMKPSDSKNQGSMRYEIEKSLEKLASARIYINQRDGRIGFYYPDERGEVIFDGAFLPIEREGKNGYRIISNPPLYRYAELTNGQFFTLTKPLLAVCFDGKKLPASMENLKLRHFLARRVYMSKPGRAAFGGKPVSPIIRFVHSVPSRKGLIEIIGFDTGTDKYTRKRKWKSLCDKVDQLLNHYELKQEILFHSFIKGETDFGRDEIIGVEIEYYSNSSI